VLPYNHRFPSMDPRYSHCYPAPNSLTGSSMPILIYDRSRSTDKTSVNVISQVSLFGQGGERDVPLVHDDRSVEWTVVVWCNRLWEEISCDRDSHTPSPGRRRGSRTRIFVGHLSRTHTRPDSQYGINRSSFYRCLYDEIGGPLKTSNPIDSLRHGN